MHQHLVAQTPLGTPIYAHSSWPLHTSPPSPATIFIGGVHGDEPEGVWIAQMALRWLEKHGSDAPPWLLIECLNPDGFSQNSRTNSRGVDLNRNFPTSDWTQNFSEPRYYPGPQAGSEPEVQGLVKILKSHKFSLIVHAHSWHPCLILTGPPTPPRSVQMFADAVGYELKEDIGYPTPGSLGDYGWKVLNIPVLCIEEQEKSPRVETESRFQGALPLLFQQTQKNEIK